MYITLENHYKFFKFLQEANFPNENFNIEQLKRAWDILEPEAFTKIREEQKQDRVIFELFVNFVDIQIKLHNKNTMQVIKTNEILNKNCSNSKLVNSELVKMHNKKFGIKEKAKKDIFAYNNTNIGNVASCLADAIGAVYSCNLHGLEKIMDLKDCNVQIAKYIKSKNDMNTEVQK